MITSLVHLIVALEFETYQEISEQTNKIEKLEINSERENTSDRNYIPEQKEIQSIRKIFLSSFMDLLAR